MKRAAILIAGGAVGLTILAATFAAGAIDSGPGSEWSGAIDEARDQLAAQSFEGLVVVEWRDQNGDHRQQMTVRQHDGVIEVVDQQRSASSDASHVVVDGQAWTLMPHAEEHASAPALTKGKYVIVRAQGPQIAHYSTTRYEARRSGHVVERLYVQAGTGLVLRREVLDPEGTVMRSVSFMRMSSARTTTSTPTTAPPHRGPRPVSELHAPYRDPASAGDGFRLLGRWSHNQKLAQLLYTDGVLSVSVFEQPGKLDWHVLPHGGTNERVANEPARRYALPVGEAWVFERGGVVYTCVGDAPPNELRSIARDVSAPTPSRTERFAQLVVEPFRW